MLKNQPDKNKDQNSQFMYNTVQKALKGLKRLYLMEEIKIFLTHVVGGQKL